MNARSIALGGLGFGALAIATLGYLAPVPIVETQIQDAAGAGGKHHSHKNAIKRAPDFILSPSTITSTAAPVASPATAISSPSIADTSALRSAELASIIAATEAANARTEAIAAISTLDVGTEQIAKLALEESIAKRDADELEMFLHLVIAMDQDSDSA